MNKKTILSSIVLSIVAVTMVACDGNHESNKGSNGVSAIQPSTDLKLKLSPLEKAQANLEAYKAKQVTLNDAYGDVSEQLFLALSLIHI